MRVFLVFLATVVIAVAVALPDHFREGVHHVQHWIAGAIDAIF
jgi:hypothetical protein